MFNVGDRVRVIFNADTGQIPTVPFLGTVVSAKPEPLFPFTVQLDNGYSQLYHASELEKIDQTHPQHDINSARLTRACKGE